MGTMRKELHKKRGKKMRRAKKEKKFCILAGGVNDEKKQGDKIEKGTIYRRYN